MSLLELPTELFQLIMDATVRSSFRQAKYARVVCKLFDAEILEATYRTRVLEEEEWRDYRVAPFILAEYTFRLVQQPKRPKAFDYFVLDIIRETADYLVEKGFEAPKTKNDSEFVQKRLKVTRTLCEMLAETGSRIMPTFHNVVARNELVSQPPPPPRLKRTVEENALPAAISLGMTSLSGQLILCSQDVRQVTYFGDAIGHAIRNADKDMISFLLGAMDQPYLTEEHVYRAARLGHSEIVQILLEVARNEASVFEDMDLTSTNSIGDSDVASDTGCYYHYTSDGEHGVDYQIQRAINLKHPAGESLLYNNAIRGASSGGSLHLIQQLVHQAADRGLLLPSSSEYLTQRNHEKGRISAHDDIYAWRLERIPSIQTAIMSTILLEAIPTNQIHVVRFAIDYQNTTNVNPNNRPLFLLHRLLLKKAITFGHLEMVELLIEQCSPNLTDDTKKVLFKIAIDHGWVKIARVLGKINGIKRLQLNGHSTYADKAFYETLLNAVANGRTDCVKFLMEERLDELKGDPSSFKNAYQRAKSVGLTSIVEYVMGCGLFSKEEILRW